MSMPEPLLRVRGLRVSIDSDDGPLPVIDGADFHVGAGETVCLVGESGSGKSVTAMSLLRLNSEPPFSYPDGQIVFDGADVLRMTEPELRRLRGDDIAVVFQDPISSLNPMHRVGDQIAEAIRAHRSVTAAQARRQAVELLDDVGIPDAAGRARQYPHEFSGGMRQRVMIAMALSCEPRLLIADEPTTALDVTTQAQILRLLTSLQAKYGMALLLVTHDLGVVARLADRVLVMYAGRIVEEAPARELFRDPLMPYTDGLLSSRPADLARRRDLSPIVGQPPRLGSWPSGCRFADRCRFVRDACTSASPPLEPVLPGHARACVLDPAELRRLRTTGASATRERAR